MNLINTLGWTLVHFLWQGTLLALAMEAVHAFVRNARARYAVACAAMLLMLVCVVATFIRFNAEAPARNVAAVPAAAASAMPAPVDTDRSHAPVTSTGDLSRLLPWLVYLWMAGVCVLTLRSLGGWIALQDFKRREARPAKPVWQQRLAQLGRRLRVSRTVKLCESTLAQVPSVIGWIRPVILMPVCALNGLTTEQLEGLLAHELAHIRQNDYLVNLLQTCVETLLFYHPAVWWVGKRMRSEREHCCDDLAVQVCGDALAYAKTLTQLELIRTGPPQLAMAANGGSLLHRVQRLLSPRPAGRVAQTGWIAGAALVLIAIVGWASPRLEQSNGPSTPQAAQQPAAAPEAAPAVPAEPASGPRTARSQVPAPAPVATQSAPAATEPLQQTAPQANSSEPKGTSFLEEIDRAGYHNLSVDQLIALKIHGVTSEFIRELRAAGYQPTVDQLLAIKIHGVMPQYIDQFKSRGWKLDIDHVVAFRIHGVDPAEVEKMAALGYQLTPDQAVAMRIHGLTPDFAAKTKELGLGNPTFDQLLALKIQGADTRFISGMKDAGLRGLDLNTLIALKIHGADPQQIKELADLGFKDLSAEEVVATRIHGVTPDFIRELRKRGFKDLTLEQIIKLKQYGIFDKQGSL